MTPKQGIQFTFGPYLVPLVVQSSDINKDGYSDLLFGASDGNAVIFVVFGGVALTDNINLLTMSSRGRLHNCLFG